MKRYYTDIDSFGRIVEREHPEGDWVKWADHAEKVARLERINKRLVAQVDWLVGALADAGQ